MRYFLVIAGLVVVVGALFAVKFTQISSLISFGKEAKKSGPPPETVATDVVLSENWAGTVTAVGSIASVKGVAVSNDAPGVVKRIGFESGQIVKEGQVLVELDTSVEYAQLAAAQARLDLAQLNVGRSRTLLASRSIAQSQLDNDEAQLKAGTTDVAQINAQIARKIVRAPFSGRLGIRTVNLGQYLNPGTPIAVLEGVEAVYVDFSLPQQRLESIHVGMPVRITLETNETRDAGADTTGMDGTISAIDPTVDATTRQMKLRAKLPNGHQELRPGMFVTVTVGLPVNGADIVIPQTALVHASYGDSVFVVEDKKADSPGPATTKTGAPIKTARQQFVRVGPSRGDFISIADGVTPGQTVVSAGAFKLKNGSSIVIDNTVKANASLSPQPANH